MLMLYLVIPLAIVCYSVAQYALLLSDLSASINQVCPASDPFGTFFFCNVSTFFSDMFAHNLGAAFMASLLAFIASALTVTHLESARIYNRSSKVITHPVLPWTLVNLITGSVTFPLLFTATLRYQEKQGSLGPAGKVTRQAGRPLTSIAESFAIPVAVLIGFFVPSVFLIKDQTSVSILVWNLFPVLVSLVRATFRAVLSRTIFRRVYGDYDLERHRTALVRLYLVPFMASCFAQYWLLAALWNNHVQLTPATKFMMINGGSLYALYAYWIFYESDLLVLAWTIISGICFGPGAGLCIGWTLQELLPSRKLNGIL